MELNLQRQSITINETVYEGSVEQPIECDALLPDYCPDVMKLLKCTIYANIGSAHVSGDRLVAEGVAVAHVYYLSEKNAVRRAEYKIPFAKTVELHASPSYPVVSVKPKLGYVNCRAVNQRRVDIRGAVNLAIKVTNAKEEQVLSDAEGGGLQLRRDMIQATDLAGQHEAVFSVSEDLELSHGKSAVNAVLRTDCHVVVQDQKVISGKVVAKATFYLHVCYQPLDDENHLETMEYALPLSQIIDADGVDEDCVCDVEMAVVSCDVQPRQNDEGEYLQFSIDAKVKALVAAYRHKEIPVAADCYSTMFECGCKSRPVSFMKLLELVREPLMHKCSLSLPEGVESVMDAWCMVDSLSWKAEEGCIDLAIALNISIFARMQDGEIAYFEQESTLQHQIQAQTCGKEQMFEATATISSCAYSLVGKEQIEMRCEFMLCGRIFCEVRCNALSEIALNEEKPKKKEQNKLYIYYADEGESVWNIAKAYNTSANAVWEENAIEQDILPAKAMLMIPII